MEVADDGTPLPGCAEYEIEIAPRPGFDPARCGAESCTFTCDDQIVWSWQWILGEPGPATLVLPKDCCECRPRRWRDRLSFWRKNPDGGKTLKWQGDVVDVNDSDQFGTVSILAYDPSFRVINQIQYVPEALNVGQAAESRFETAWKLTDQLDPSGLELIRVGPFGVNTFTQYAQWSELGQILAELADLGVEWTVVGDRLYFGDLSGTLGGYVLDPATHWDANAADLLDAGEDEVTHVIVQNPDPDNGWTAVFPSILERDPCVGVHTHRVEVDESMKIEAGLELAARLHRQLSGAGVRVNTADEASISASWPIPLCDMRPGGSVEVEPSSGFCLDARVAARLRSVIVEGVGCKETSIKVSLA